MGKDIRPLNDKGERHGLWEYYYGGKLEYKCFYHNGKEVGYEEWYYHYTDGKSKEKKYYI
jgi:antitoxin component YwqK of YwqJK toxin-antitoxin module